MPGRHALSKLGHDLLPFAGIQRAPALGDVPKLGRVNFAVPLAAGNPTFRRGTGGGVSLRRSTAAGLGFTAATTGAIAFIGGAIARIVLLGLVLLLLDDLVEAKDEFLLHLLSD